MNRGRLLTTYQAISPPMVMLRTLRPPPAINGVHIFHRIRRADGNGESRSYRERTSRWTPGQWQLHKLFPPSMDSTARSKLHPQIRLARIFARAVVSNMWDSTTSGLPDRESTF